MFDVPSRDDVSRVGVTQEAITGGGERKNRRIAAAALSIFSMAM